MGIKGEKKGKVRDESGKVQKNRAFSREETLGHGVSLVPPHLTLRVLWSKINTLLTPYSTVID